MDIMPEYSFLLLAGRTYAANLWRTSMLQRPV